MIPYSKQYITQDDIDAVVEVLKSDYLTGGSITKEFERSLSQYTQTEYATVVNSATSALHIAYMSAGISEGDEVITTPITFVATSNMLLEVGAKPVFVDTFFNGNINPKKIEEAITPKTKAIVSVDYSGNPVDVKAIRAVADKHNLIWISDSSHALGSSIDGMKVGSFADMTIFSFHAIKPITTGEGGAVVTNNKNFHETLQLLKSHGIVKREFWNQDMQSFGYNFRLTDFGSALGLSQLSNLDSSIAKREEIAQYYNERFKDNQNFTTLRINEGVVSSHHLYPITLNRELWCPKEDIYTELQNSGLGVQVHYKPVYQHTYYKTLYPEIRLLNAEDFYKAELSIPCHQEMSLEDAKGVADKVIEITEKHSFSSCKF